MRNLYTFLIYLLLLPFMVACNSCSLLGIKSIHPVDAGVPKLIFYYTKDNRWRMVNGHGGDTFTKGEVKRFKIVLPKKGDWELRYLSGNEDVSTQKEKDVEYIMLEDGKYDEKTPSVLGFSVFDDKQKEVINGYFYPNVDEVKNKLRISYDCPYQRTNNNISSCTRPANFPFKYHVYMDYSDGPLYMATQCTSGYQQSGEVNLKKGEERVFTLTVKEKDFCMVGLNSKQGDKNYAHFLYVRFYDPKYSE